MSLWVFAHVHLRCGFLMGCSHARDFLMLSLWVFVGLLRPYVSGSTSALELKDLETAGVYIAGFTDPSCVSLVCWHFRMHDGFVCVAM